MNKLINCFYRARVILSWYLAPGELERLPWFVKLFAKQL